MSIRLTLIGLLSILTAIVAYAGYTTFRDVTAINNKLAHYSEITIPSLTVLNQIGSNVTRFRYVEAEYIFTRSRTSNIEKAKELYRIRDEIAESVENYKKLVDAKNENASLRSFIWSWNRYLTHHEDIVKLSNEGRIDDAAAIYEIDMGEIMTFIIRTIDNIMMHERTTVNHQRSEAATQYETAKSTLFVGLSLTLVISLCATVFAIFGVSRPLGHLSQAMQRLADGGADVDVELRKFGTSGEIGAIAMAVERFKDKAAERAAILEEARAGAEAGSKAKANFIASMSHEIRTPLNGVLGMAQSLFADELRADQRDKVSIILESGNALMALLNDVLDMSKIDAGKMEIVAVDEDLRATVTSIAQLFQAGAEDKGVELKVDFDPDIPERLRFDPVRLRQCISNLVSNAIKFTALGGRAEIEVACKRLAGGDYRVTVLVADTGIGMAPGTIARLFEVFTQADGSISRRFGGSGLGLVICRRLAQAMGGDVEVESELGAGSRFRLTFMAKPAAPLAAPMRAETAEEPEAPPLSAALNGAHILIVDDNAVNRHVVKLFLKLLDVEVTEAANGKEAMEALARTAFDIVLLDVHMPVMDGAETIKAIRQSGEPWSSIPTIALTADAMTGDRERYLAMGMSDYLAKPIDQRELLSKMAKALAPHLVDHDTVAGPTPETPRRRNSA